MSITARVTKCSTHIQKKFNSEVETHSENLYSAFTLISLGGFVNGVVEIWCRYRSSKSASFIQVILLQNVKKQTWQPREMVLRFYGDSY
jgi:hypothetical protein